MRAEGGALTRTLWVCKREHIQVEVALEWAFNCVRRRLNRRMEWKCGNGM